MVTSDNPVLLIITFECILRSFSGEQQPCLLGGGPQAPPTHSTVGGGERGTDALCGDTARHHRQVCLENLLGLRAVA